MKKYLFFNIIILLCVYVLFRINLILIKQYYNYFFYNSNIISTITNFNNAIFGETFDETLTTKHSMTNTINKSLVLQEYVIKSSLNSAYNSSINTIDKSHLISVINQGCRWLDFEIFSVKQKPEVGFSSLNSFTTMESSNSIPFNIITNIINSSAFSSPCPNPLDPLFINLRIKSKHISILSDIQSAINSSFNMSLYQQKINPATTLLSDLQSSVIIVVDIIHSMPEISGAFTCDNILPNCKLIQTFNTSIQLFCGTSEFSLLSPEQLDMNVEKEDNKGKEDKGGKEGKEGNKLKKSKSNISQVQLLPDGVNTNVSVLQCLLPDVNIKSNPNILPIIGYYGIQISPYRFDISDTNLTKYNNFFNHNGNVAFVPLGKAIQYTLREL